MNRAGAAALLLALACSPTGGAPPAADRDEATPPVAVGASPATVETTPPLRTEASPHRLLPADFTLSAEVVVSGIDHPVYVTSPPGDPRLFIVQQGGRIRVVRDGHLVDEPFLNLRDRVLAGGERGLLGLAFHPDYADNGRLFVYYTSRPDGSSRLEEYRAGAGADVADPTSGRVLLEVAQPTSIHNGGMLTFGPDGYLYLAIGDGGPAKDPPPHGQDPSTLLGGILRLDVDRSSGGRGYAIPPTNPFADGGGAPEVWAYGLRNPWRFSFDRGLLYVGDVGRYHVEEVNVVPADAAGTNFGWPVWEGGRCLRGSGCPDDGFVAPVLTYPHDAACAVIGGVVYRGAAMPELAGHYLYADLCGGWVRSFRYDDGAVTDEHHWTDHLPELVQPSSFGIDATGEVYVTTIGPGQDQGTVYRLVRGG